LISSLNVFGLQKKQRRFVLSTVILLLCLALGISFILWNESFSIPEWKQSFERVFGTFYQEIWEKFSKLFF